MYIPKNRIGLDIGSYVIIKPIKEKKLVERYYFYGVKPTEPIKLSIIKKIMKIADKNIENYENIIITGSFLDKGFWFNDVDTLILLGKK